MFTLIQNGSVYAPEPLGTVSVLLANGRIAQVGAIDAREVERFTSHLDVPLDVIDASGCFVVPGLIDPHQHLIGAGGEHGFGSRLPEVPLEQIVMAGITTVVGLLGTDTVTREPSCLYAKVRQLQAEGISAYMFTGGFELPPRTLMASVIDDLVHIDCIIGTGEIALADSRWINPPLQDLAFTVAQTALGGKMAGKAGVSHFHIGERQERLALLNDLLDGYPIEPQQVYITHITRSQALLTDAIALAKRGAYVDMDAVEPIIVGCVKDYVNRGGALDRLTVSSDANTPGGSPAKFYAEFVKVARESGLPLETVIPFFSSNAAAALHLHNKGHIAHGSDSDILVVREASFELTHVFAQGRALVRDGELVVRSQQTQTLEEGQP